MNAMKDQRPPEDVPLCVRHLDREGPRFSRAVFTRGPGGATWFEKIPGRDTILRSNVTHWDIANISIRAIEEQANSELARSRPPNTGGEDSIARQGGKAGG